MEILKQIPFAKQYSVSSLGYVINTKKNKKLKPRLNDRGYESIVIYTNGKPKSYRIGRLVLSIFTNVDYVNYPKEANHIDENKLNNNISNLNWLTRKENMNWNNLGFRIKRSGLPNPNAAKAAKEKNSKKVIAKSIANGKEIIFNSMTDAKKSGFNIGNISACCLGKRKKHLGYSWSFYINGLAIK